MNKEIEYLKEHLYEIYKYKKSMKDLTYDMDLEHLLRTCKALDYSQQEIERLNKQIEEYQKALDETTSEKMDLENIIKEVRKYINSIDEIEVRYLDKEALYRNHITEYQIQEQLKKDKTLEGHFVKVNKYYLLEILDKEKQDV